MHRVGHRATFVCTYYVHIIYAYTYACNVMCLCIYTCIIGIIIIIITSMMIIVLITIIIIIIWFIITIIILIFYYDFY